MSKPQRPSADRDYEGQLRDMNEALLVSSVRQHELTEQAHNAEQAQCELTDKALQLNAQLCASEARFRTLFDLGPAAVYTCDASGVIREFNRRAADLWGREPAPGDTDERFSGSFRMIRPDGSILAHHFCPMAEVLSGAIPHARDAEVSIERPDGSRVNVVVNIRPLKNERGEITGAINCFHDITERKQAEAALRESAERFRSLVSVITDVPWTTDPEGSFVTPQEPYSRYTGKTWEELRGFGWVECIHPDDRDELARLWRHAVATRTVYYTPCRQWHGPTQQWRHVIARGTPVLNADGSVREWAGSLTDVEDQHRAEQALRESEERFRMVADNMAPLAWTCNTLGDVTWYNQRWLDYTGLSFEEMKGWNWSKVQHPDHLDRVVKRVQHSAETGEPWEDTFPLRGKDGSYRWFLSRALAIRDAHGKVVRWFGTNTDVTEQRELEMHSHQQAAELSELHRRKDEFLAMLSHELRNPLAPIANAVYLLRLQSGNESPAGQQARAVIERQVGQLKHLIDDLLEVSRITTGRIHLHQERITVGGVVANAVETTRTLIAHRGHTLNVSVPPEPIWLYADAARLEQVVVNLLTNAAKYTDAGGHIGLDVELASRERDRPDECVLRVRDTGVGIAPELLPRIFDLFTQADRSLARSEGGLGIGLSLVQRLVELHGGTVEAKSVLGKGSEFIVRLPMTTMSPSQSHSDTDQQIGESCRVLVVDDNVDSAESMAMLLRESRHEARTVHDGSTALQAALDFRPDVVLLDIGLPRLNGFEVAKRIRQQPTLKNTVLVAMTGYGQESDRQRSREAGFDHHLVKPVEFGKVKQILASVSEKPN